ncbi:PREDICTED: ankyrin-1-like [Priapulus caudatus]|uniref:Ankyrin-1-like n=1 Tax=Priapulus caudatus TaxID=37621 RepID=A0ABM1ER32_PRICU|nr:PREDICTED: ankyrin-1-like [Priapulus caudatus]
MAFPLHKAAFEGDLRNIVQLAEVERKTGETLPLLNNSQNTPLHSAARSGNADVITWFLKSYDRIDPYQKNVQKETCAHIAATYGHIDALKVIIVYVEHRERLNTPENAISYEPDAYGNSILHRAIMGKQTEVAAWIIGQYSNEMLWLKNTDGATALHVAAGIGDVSIVKQITTQTKELTSSKDHQAATPVFYAASYGKLDCVQYLAENGLTGVETTNIKGENPLHVAAQGGHIRTVEYLETKMKSGCWLKQTRSGATPLHLAAATNQDVVVDHCLQRKDAAKVKNAVDKNQNSASHVAAELESLESFRLLVLSGAVIAKKNKARTRHSFL